MKLDEFDFELPQNLIAQRPLDDRAASKLLILDKETGAVSHRMFKEVVDILLPGDLLVLNDTRVTARRLIGRKTSGAKVECLVLCETPEGHIALTKPAKKLPVGTEIRFAPDLTALVLEDLSAGRKRMHFQSSRPLSESFAEVGTTPLPPYIHAPLPDEERYQTVYSSSPGSAAAPTAGLHFTNEILDTLARKGVSTARVTLDVGLDTFRPVQSEDIEEHLIHGETCYVPEETVKAVAEANGRIIAVGTTSVRTLESFAIGHRELSSGRKATKLFITPGYRFQIVDGLFTNFHLPKTTMLFMVAALCGRDALLAAYREAIAEKYRMLSLGDSMLVI